MNFTDDEERIKKNKTSDFLFRSLCKKNCLYRRYDVPLNDTYSLKQNYSIASTQQVNL